MKAQSTPWRGCWRLVPERPGEGRTPEAAREAAARAAHRPVPQSPPPGSSGGFLSHPADAPVSSEFGLRFHPIWQQWILHAGIDFAAGCGSPVYAAAGRRRHPGDPEGDSGGYGNRLVIDHGLEGGVDLTTTYNHLTSFVATGGHVSRASSSPTRAPRDLDGLSPALRDPSGRHPGQPASLVVMSPVTSGR
jgi:murein DD-endopeptidase MepM/ murein hydrolase activator NlpD